MKILSRMTHSNLEIWILIKAGLLTKFLQTWTLLPTKGILVITKRILIALSIKAAIRTALFNNKSCLHNTRQDRAKTEPQQLEYCRHSHRTYKETQAQKLITNWFRLWTIEVDCTSSSMLLPTRVPHELNQWIRLQQQIKQSLRHNRQWFLNLLNQKLMWLKIISLSLLVMAMDLKVESVSRKCNRFRPRSMSSRRS